MNIGKMDGNHCSLSVANKGFSFFLPQTIYTNSIAFGMAWSPVGRSGFNPFVSFFVLNVRARPFGRMWFMRWPHNIVRIGKFGDWNELA